MDHNLLYMYMYLQATLKLAGCRLVVINLDFRQANSWACQAAWGSMLSEVFLVLYSCLDSQTQLIESCHGRDKC